MSSSATAARRGSAWLNQSLLETARPERLDGAAEDVRAEHAGREEAREDVALGAELRRRLLLPSSSSSSSSGGSLRAWRGRWSRSPRRRPSPARRLRQQHLHNADWENNNILASLFYAEDLMDEPFICCYSDVLFTPDVVARLAASPDDMVLGVDTAWLERYEHRTDHPPDDAEKVTVAERPRHAQSIARFPRPTLTASTSAWRSSRPPARPGLREHYHRRRKQFAGQPWREAEVFEKAYKILLFQDMIEAGERFAPRRHAGRLHRGRYAAGFRIRAATLD